MTKEDFTKAAAIVAKINTAQNILLRVKTADSFAIGEGSHNVFKVETTETSARFAKPCLYVVSPEQGDADISARFKAFLKAIETDLVAQLDALNSELAKI